MFNFWIAHKLCYCWKYLKHQRRQIETYILGFLVVVSLSFTTYTYSHILIFTLYGITIAYIFEAEKLIRKGYQLIQTSKIGK
jgi:chromate transport protein ChrA